MKKTKEKSLKIIVDKKCPERDNHATCVKCFYGKKNKKGFYSCQFHKQYFNSKIVNSSIFRKRAEDELKLLLFKKILSKKKRK